MAHVRHADRLTRLLHQRAGNPRRAAEIGVFRGDTSVRLLRAFTDLHLVLVDSWSTHTSEGAYWRSGDRCARLTQSEQDANAVAATERTEFAAGRREILRMPSSVAAMRVDDSSLDFAFLDGDHTYAGVQTDLTAWWPKIRPGGVLCGHDYGHPRDLRGVWGVSRAVDAFLKDRGLTVRLAGKTLWWVEKSDSSESEAAAVVEAQAHGVDDRTD